MSTILLDFESRSEADLSVLGGRLYWAHPSTRAVCCWLYEVESGEWACWLPGDPCPFGPDDVLAAHNWDGFDRFGVAALGWRTLDAGPPAIDTSAVARTAGLPGALDELAKRWLGREKDHAGNAVTRRLSGIKAPLRKVEKGIRNADGSEYWDLAAKEIKEWLSAVPGRVAIERMAWEVPAEVQAGIKEYEREWKRLGRMPDEIPPVVLEFVLSYGKNDVQIMADAWPRLEEWLDAELPGVVAVDRAINDRGVHFDSDLARALHAAIERNQKKAVDECAAALTAASLGEVVAAPDEVRAAASSPEQFCEITGAPDATATTVASMDHPLATLRKALASIAGGKLTAALSSVSPDGRLRDILRYFAAHTGRWGGKRFQPQNLPRPDKRFEEWTDDQICALASAVIEGRHEPDAFEIDLLVRACLKARPGHVLLWADYSAVEGRGVAWAANDRDALQVYIDNLDPYKVDAQIVYPSETYDSIQKWQRQIGKVCNLALGFGGGEGAFANMAQSLGVDVSQIDTRAVIEAWRAGRKPTVRFWYELNRAMIAAHQYDRPVECGPFQFCPADGGSTIAAVLPSGRPVVYWGVQVSEGHGGRPSLSYEGANFREHLYGGKILENLVQAMCRDMLADALVRLEAAGLPPVLHVHDEPVTEVPITALDRARETIATIMTTLPRCYDGFPPKANVDFGERYRK